MQNAAIIGVGLIGGSLGMGMVARGLADRVTGVGRNENNLQVARDLGAVTDYTTDTTAGVRDAELIVLALPVGLIVPTLQRIVPFLKPGTVVTDVGSTKAQIVTAAEALVPSSVHFIGGHPMAGSEREGVRAADRYLFEGAYYILTPTPRTHPHALDVMSGLIEGLGATGITLNPSDHDRCVAAVSHFPHLVASSVMNAVFGMADSARMLTLAAGGFRDTTRIASGNPEVWRDILLSNRKPLLEMVERYRRELRHIEDILTEGDADRLTEWLGKARHARAKLPSQAKGYLRDLYRVDVTVSDQPGSIAAIAGTLCRHRINIADIEVLRVREGEGGTVRMAFGTEIERDRASLLLGADGFTVSKRQED